MKKLFFPLILIVCLLSGFAALGAPKLVAPSEEFFVADYANVLTERTRQDIVLANEDLEQRCNGAQIVIVTVEFLGGTPSDEYATKLFTDWEVGSSEAHNGMLLLLATGELKGWLTVGSGISGSFTGRMVDEYLDEYFWPDVDAREFDTAVRNICEVLFSWYADYYGVNQDDRGGNYTPAPDTGYSPPVQPTAGQGRPEGYYGYNVPDARNAWSDAASRIVLFIIIFILIAIIAVARTDRRRHRAYYVHMGMPIPRYHWWYMWGYRPHRVWYRSNWRGPGGRGGPRGPGGYGGPPRGSGGGRSSGGYSGGGRSAGGSNRSGGGFGGFGGSSGGSGGGRSGGGFGGFGGSSGGGRSGGGFSGGGGHSGGGGGRAGGGGGRR